MQGKDPYIFIFDSDKNLLKSCLLGFTLATTLYLIVGLLGYATYGNSV